MAILIAIVINKFLLAVFTVCILKQFTTKIELYTVYKQAKNPTEAKPSQPTSCRGAELDHYQQPTKEANIKPVNRDNKPPSNKNVSKLIIGHWIRNARSIQVSTIYSN